MTIDHRTQMNPVAMSAGEGKKEEDEESVDAGMDFDRRERFLLLEPKGRSTKDLVRPESARVCV